MFVVANTVVRRVAMRAVKVKTQSAVAVKAITLPYNLKLNKLTTTTTVGRYQMRPSQSTKN